MIEVALSMVLIGTSLCYAVMVYCITAARRGVEGVKSFWVVPRGVPRRRCRRCWPSPVVAENTQKPPNSFGGFYVTRPNYSTV
jgi:hypothetical protein